MSERVLKILLSELKTVRLKCQRQTCKSVVEVSVERLEQMFEGRDAPACPVCQGSYQHIDGSRPSPFAHFAVAVKRLQQCKDSVEIEFVMPDPGESKPA